jgi:diguanylate cyclase (GGDEF)-like protein
MDVLETKHPHYMKRHHLLRIFIWPAICLFLALGMCITVYLKLFHEKESLRKEAFNHAISISEDYAQDLSREVGQIDQIIRSVEFQWQESNGNLQLERQANRGMYPSESKITIGITDASGKIKTALLAKQRGLDLSDRAYFHLHRSGKAKGLLIVPLDKSRMRKEPVIHFSRPLSTPQHEFAGLAFVSVKRDYFSSFYDRSMQGKDEMFAMLDSNGSVLVSSMSGNTTQPALIPKQQLLLPSKSGVQVLDGNHFLDGVPRIVAWHAVDNYPLIAVAALAEPSVYAKYEAMRDGYIQLILVATGLLLVIALMGMNFSMKLTSRRAQAERIKNTFRIATDNANEAFFMMRAISEADGQGQDFVIEDCNQRGVELFPFTKDKLLGMRLTALYPHKSDAVLSIYRAAMERGFYEDEFRIKDSKNQSKWLARRIIRSENGLAVTLRDITEAKLHEQELISLANQDELTGIPNRRWLRYYLPTCIERAQQERRAFAVLYIDLDNFNVINNTAGHSAGDIVLKTAVQRIEQLLHRDDHIARLGGDEFAVILTNVSSEDSVIQTAIRIIDKLSRPYDVNSQLYHNVNASIGISLFPEHGQDMHMLLKHADVAMYAAKANGKGTYQLYSPILSERILEKINKEEALRTAIKEDQFSLHYQPRIDSQSGELRSMEALVRWIGPDGQIIAPMEFIPLAEETGLIVELGTLVLHKACAQITAWQAQGLKVKPISVNVSAKQFLTKGLKDTILHSLNQYGVAPALLEIEITESCMMNTDEVASEISVLKSLGVRIAVDDFGTGYSSLSQLQQLDIDVIKVDKSFTKSLATGVRGESFFMTILSMAHILGMQVVAEGVETHEQLEILQNLKCNEIQGYLVSKPVPAEQAQAFLNMQSLLPAPAINKNSEQAELQFLIKAAGCM